MATCSSTSSAFLANLQGFKVFGELVLHACKGMRASGMHSKSYAKTQNLTTQTWGLPHSAFRDLVFSELEVPEAGPFLHPAPFAFEGYTGPETKLCKVQSSVLHACRTVHPTFRSRLVKHACRAPCMIQKPNLAKLPSSNPAPLYHTTETEHATAQLRMQPHANIMHALYGTPTTEIMLFNL